MIAFEQSNALQLHLRKPSRRARWTRDLLWYRPSETSATFALENTRVRFDFARDDLGGLRLATFKRLASSHTWINDEPDLFRLVVFDATGSSPLGTSVVQPRNEQLSVGAVLVEPGAQKLVATWTGLKIGNVDEVDVTVTLRLAADADWLDVTATLAWNGTATKYAVDSLSVLPLRVRAKNAGRDFAAIPQIRGIQVGDPVRNLRYDPSDGRPATLFNGFLRNVAVYPSGRGCPMPVWGYYEDVEREGWMAWLEQGDEAFLNTCFQSDGTRMLWEVTQPQPDHVLVGNGARALGSRYHFCLRPFRYWSAHGWWDVARQYRRRLDSLEPSWLAPRRRDNPGLSNVEKRPLLLLDVQHPIYSGPASYLVPYLTTLRANLGMTAADPIAGTGAFQSNLLDPFEEIVGTADERATLADLYELGIHLGVHQAGIVVPPPYYKPRLADGSFRWWNAVLDYREFRTTRAGYFAGGGADFRAEAPLGVFWRERTYPVQSWNGGTKTVTILGTPLADGFKGALTATLVPATATRRLASAEVQSLGIDTVRVASDFRDATGAVVVPTVTHSLAVHRNIGTSGMHRANCPHALVNASSALQAVKDNVYGGRFAVWRGSAAYADVWSEVVHNGGLDEDRQSCYADHSDWPKVDPGYVRHPKGGGRWWRVTSKALFSALREDVRARQVAQGDPPAFFFSCEDLDEGSQGIWDYAWTVASSGHLWRNLGGRDPALDQVMGVPMFAVVHAGRTWGRAALNEFTNGIALATSPAPGFPPPRTDDALHDAFGYFLAIEWPYGLALPAFMVWSDDVNGQAVDLFDDSIYAPEGPVSAKVRQLRDLWASLVRAEMNWVLRWLRNGDFLALLPLNADATTTTTGLADTLYATYYTYDCVYPRAAVPNVVHGVWRNPQNGSVLVLLVNWTDTAANWSATIDLDRVGFPTGSQVRQVRLDANAQVLSTTELAGGQKVGLAVTAFPAFTFQALLFFQPSDGSPL